MGTLNLLWTTDSPDTAMLMIREYTTQSLAYKWWEHVRIILWGGSVRLIKDNKYIQVSLMQMAHLGIEIVADKNCVDSLDAAELFESLEIEIRYMGKELTDIINDDTQKVITI